MMFLLAMGLFLASVVVAPPEELTWRNVLDRIFYGWGIYALLIAVGAL